MVTSKIRSKKEELKFKKERQTIFHRIIQSIDDSAKRLKKKGNKKQEKLSKKELLTIKQKTGIKVGDIMTRNFVSIGEEKRIVDASQLMIKKLVGSLVVIKDRQVRGIITEGDITWAISKNIDIFKRKVKDIMTKKIISISPEKEITEAIILMKNKKIRWLPVIVNKHIVGFLTLKDILKIQPTLVDIVLQKTRIAEYDLKVKKVQADPEKKWIKQGKCEECGANDILYKKNKKYVCGVCVKE